MVKLSCSKFVSHVPISQSCVMLQFILSIFFISFSIEANAQDSAAETAAKNFVAHLDTISPATIYESDMAPSFVQAVRKENFVANVGMTRIQSGGIALARQLIGGQAFSQNSNGQSGTFYYVRFKTKYPSALIFQDIYLEKVSDRWKIQGYWLLPAPQN